MVAKEKKATKLAVSVIAIIMMPLIYLELKRFANLLIMDKQGVKHEKYYRGCQRGEMTLKCRSCKLTPSEKF